MAAGPPRTPVQAFLDRAGIPWRLSRAEAAARSGVVPSPSYGWPVVRVEDGGAFGPLIEPLGAHHRAGDAPHCPFPVLSAQAWSPSRWPGRPWAGAAERNLRAVSARVAAALGPPRVGSDSVNVVQHEWRWGASAITLLAYPRHLQDRALRDPARERDPRLRDATSITVAPGWRPALSPSERAALASLDPLDSRPALVRDGPVSPYAIEFEREPEGAPVPHRLSVTRDRALLVAAEDRLMVLDLRHATGLAHDVLTPAKGGGGAFLSVALLLPWGAKEVTVARGDASGALDRVAALAAEATGLPLRRAEQPDC